MRFSQDTLLLACFAAGALSPRPGGGRTPPGGRAVLGESGRRVLVVDLGCGCGASAIALLKLAPDVRVLGVDVSEELVESAERNCVALGLEERADFRVGDVADFWDGPPFCDAVQINPPYWDEGAGKASNRPLNELARRARGGVSPFLRCADRLLKDRGRLFLVYPAGRLLSLAEDLAACGFGARRMRLVRSHASDDASRVLVEARKGLRHACVFEPDLVTRERTEDGGTKPTAEARAFCRWIR